MADSGSKMHNDPSAIYRTGAWAGQFVDVYLTDTELEGGHTEVALRTVTGKLREAALHFGDILGPARWTDAKRFDVLRLADMLGAASDRAAHFGHPLSGDALSPAFAAAVKKMADELAAVPSGGAFIFPGASAPRFRRGRRCAVSIHGFP